MVCAVDGECSQPVVPTSKGSGLAAYRLAVAAVVRVSDPLITSGRRVLEGERTLVRGKKSVELTVCAHPQQEFEFSSQFPPPAVARALEEDMRTVLQHTALRTIRRLMREEPLPERSQRRVVKDGAAKARHVHFGMPVRLQRRTGQVVRRVERLEPQEIVAGVRHRSSVLVSPIRPELDGEQVLCVCERALVAVQWSVRRSFRIFVD